MINILVLAAGKSRFESNDDYPLCLLEIDGFSVIERIEKYVSECESCRIIFVFRREEVQKFHLDKVVDQLDVDVEVVELNSETSGAACTALMAISYIDNDDELLILNGDEYIDGDASRTLAEMRTKGFDAGVLVFDSIHPRYSFVKLDSNDMVLEAAEKNPISRNATVGFYWYAHGKEFVSGAKNMIRKDARVNGAFFVCPVFNELVLLNKKVGALRIDTDEYHPLKTEQQLDRDTRRVI